MDKQYPYSEREKQIANFWAEQNVFHFDPEGRAEIFIVDTPPPTVSGKLHIGHVFSYTHADLICRYQKMLGKNVFYPMGFDENGLPTEKFVTKKSEIKIGQISRAKFRKICLEECAIVKKEFETLWRSLGLSIDWSISYSTISKEVMRASQYSFVDLYEKGFIQRKAEPFIYCTTCRTSVAQAELDWQEKSSTFNTLEFTSESGQPLYIATTRPELLPACVAIFFHPADTRYQHLAGTTATVPVFGQQVKLLPDPVVDPEKGTGLVMCCTFGDQADVAWYKQHQLNFIHAIGIDGKMTPACGELAGLKVEEARTKVLELLSQQGLLKDQKKFPTGVNVHERCGKEIEYQIIKQWFIKIVEYKSKFLQLAELIQWQPEHMKSRYIDWVSKLSWDWCISRQRLFGIPIPVWNCTSCDTTVLAKESALPLDPVETSPKSLECPNCSEKLAPETDVLDTWATSAITPLIIAGWPDHLDERLFPCSMRPQAHDIIRTWAFYTIVKTYYHLGQIPWKKLLISGHVLAGKEKISKSKENAINSPEQVIKDYSADAVRFWAASAKLGVDTLFDTAKLKNGGRTTTKLWNAFSFLAQHLGKLAAAPERPPQLDELSQWLLHNLSSTQAKYHQHFAKNDYSLALETIERFFWTDLCDNYLEIVKDVLFNPQYYSLNEAKSARFAMFTVGMAVLQMYAPFLPFVTEAIFQELFIASCRVKSLHQTLFDLKTFYDFPTANHTIELLIRTLVEVRKLKSAMNASLKTEITPLTIVGAEEHLKLLEKHTTLIKGVTKATEIIFETEAAEVVTENSVTRNDGRLQMRIFVQPTDLAKDL